MRLVSGLLALAIVVSAASAEPDTLTLEVLLHHMASTRGVVAEFREVKTLALLAEPLESRGTLYFQPPDRFVRTTREPAATRLALVGARMQFEDATGTSQLDLADDPVARQFATNLMALWRGDRAQLEALYRLEFAATEARWTLGLVPRKPPLDRFITRIRLAGDGATMREMELFEVDGDRTLTSFEKSDVDHAFGPEEAQRVFGVE
ncbi:MAG: outer membrane lipoprotein carrier protein LolA [Myxococcota bacterium]